VTDYEIYEKFIEYVSNPAWEFTASEHKMPMVTSFLTPEEAEFLTGFPKKTASLDEIADLKDMDTDELIEKIKPLCKKGLIYEAINPDSVRYQLWSSGEMFLRAPYWGGRDEEPLKSTAPHTTKYYIDGWFDQTRHVEVKGLRALPINETVEAGTEHLPYEDVLKRLGEWDYYSVSHCVCRERHRLDPDYVDSPFPSETCLHFGELGRYCVENGLGREITKEETLAILKQSADAGLVHGVANAQEKHDTI